MKVFKSLFTDSTYTKVEYVPNDINDNKFHVYKRTGRFGTWLKYDERKTLEEAEEYAKSRGESVIYMGIYENGIRKGMTDWEDKPLKHSPEQVLELRRKSYESYKPEMNREEAAPIEFERKYLRRVSKG